MCRCVLSFLVWSAVVFGQCRKRVARVQQINALRQVLEECNSHELAEWIFVDEARLRGPLRALITDRKVGDRALRILALIGDPSDLEVMIHQPPNGESITEDRWKYSIVSTLLQPRSENQWEFLHNAAISDNDRWVDAGAILTLQLNHSPRSERILEEVAVKNPRRAGMVARALALIQTNPPAFEGKAIVPIILRSGWNRLTHTATFHRIGTHWMRRGVRETLQAFGMPPFPMIITKRTVPLLDEPPPVIDPIRVPPVQH